MVRRRVRRWFVWALLFGVLPVSAHAQRAWFVRESTGDLVYRVDLVLPPGTAGHGPDIALEYTSGSGGSAGWLGLGWRVTGVEPVMRALDFGPPWDLGNRTCGPQGDAPCYRDVFTMGGEPLVCEQAVCDGTYRRRVDDGRQLRFLGVGLGWEIRDVAGRTWTYGSSPASRTDHPETGETFIWQLDRVEDRNGNWIEYVWDSGSSQGVAYLAEVRWGQVGAAANRRVLFVLNDPVAAPRPDPAVSYRAGFRQETDRRLVEIRVLAAGDALVTRYALAYSQDPDSTRSELESVTRIGHDGTTAERPHVFAYSAANVAFAAVGAPSFTTSGCGQPAFEDMGGPVWARVSDMNGDGIADVFRAVAGDSTRVAESTGSSFPPSMCFGGTLWDEALLNFSNVGAGGTQTSEITSDLDGDARLDHLSTAIVPAPGQWGWRRGTDSGFAAMLGIDPPDPALSTWALFTIPPSPFAAFDVRVGALETVRATLDITGDGVADHVLTRTSEPWDEFDAAGLPSAPFWQAWEGWVVFPGAGDSNGAPQFGEPFPWPAAGGGPLDARLGTWSEHTQIFVDINGDGLPDRLWGNVGGASLDMTVAFNTGAGFAPAEALDSLDLTGSILSSGVRYEVGCKWIDVFDLNSDGLPDHVSALSGVPGYWRVFWGNGRGFETTASLISAPGVSDSNFTCIEAPVSWIGGSGYGVLADMDGDGMLDRTGISATTVHLNQGERSGLMVSATSPLGGTASFVFESSAESRDTNGFPSNPDLPRTRSVVVETTEDGGQPDSPPVVTRYRYAGGVFDDTFRRFVAFETVERSPIVEGVVAATWTSTHRTDGVCGRARAGLEIEGPSGQLIEQHDSTFEETLTTAGAPWGRCLLVEQTVAAIEGDPASARTMRTVWDYGADPIASDFNVMAIDAWGAWDPANSTDIPGDERRTEFEYVSAGAQTGLVSSRRILDGAGNVVDHERYFYDDLGYGQAQRGLLTRRERWLENPHTAPPFVTGWVPVESVEHDAAGNAVTITGPPTAENANGRTTESVYDGVYNTFVTSRSVGSDTSAPLVTTVALDSCPPGEAPPPGLGLACISTASTGATTRFSFDALGRRVRAEWPTSLVDTITRDESAPGWVETSAEADPNGAVLTRVREVDGLGRVVRFDQPGHAGQIVRQRFAYDALGLLERETLPFDSANEAPRWREIEYEAGGRVAAWLEPDGTVVTFERSGWRVTETVYFGDPASAVAERRTERAIDGRGRLVEQVEYVDAANSADALVTAFRYDPMDRLIFVDDAIANDPGLCTAAGMGTACATQSHTTAVRWDTFGHRVAIDDPDAGTWNFAYDAAGLLRARADGAGRVQTLLYDEQHRLVSKNFWPEGDGSANVSYEYGATPNSPAFGRLVAATNAHAAHRYTWDTSGVIAHEQDTSGQTFVSRVERDAHSRLIAREFPDGERFTYEYDGDRLVAVRGESNNVYPHPVIDSATYDAQGRLTAWTLGQGIASQVREFSPTTGRLSRSQGQAGPLLSDADGDDVTDAADNCPYAYNPDQEDRGGVGGAGSDGIGDRCQCGDVTLDGTVGTWDFFAIALQAAGVYNGMTEPGPALCDLDGDGTCGQADYDAVLAGAESGAVPPGCAPARADSLPGAGGFDVATAFDGLGRLTSEFGVAAGRGVDRAYAYDGLSRLVGATGRREPGSENSTVTWSYVYDPLGNLAAQTSTGGYARSWSFDHPTKPRFATRVVVPGATRARTADAGGKLATGPALHRWNAQNRLHEVATTGTRVFYDAFDRPVLTSVAAFATAELIRVGGDFVYDATRQIANKSFRLGGVRVASLATSYEAPPVGASAPLFGRAPGRASALALFAACLSLVALVWLARARPRVRWARLPAAVGLSTMLAMAPDTARATWTTPPQPTWLGMHAEPLVAFLIDPLGSPLAVVNAKGIVLEEREYAPYGLGVRHTGVFDVDPGFAGHRQAAAFGYVDMGARTYDAESAAFLSPDPGAPAAGVVGLARYTYAAGLPTSQIDPDGRIPLPVAAALVGVVASIASALAAAAGYPRLSVGLAAVGTVAFIVSGVGSVLALAPHATGGTIVAASFTANLGPLASTMGLGQRIRSLELEVEEEAGVAPNDVLIERVQSNRPDIAGRLVRVSADEERITYFILTDSGLVRRDVQIGQPVSLSPASRSDPRTGTPSEPIAGPGSIQLPFLALGTIP